MSGDEDDYLSDKFLATLSSNPAPKTYSQLRKEADKKAKLKNEQNRIKSRRQREVEAREEGLSKSLFERANEEQEAGIASGNKALSMMMKMGFKPGQSLGRVEDVATPPSDKGADTDLDSGYTASTKSNAKQITEPIPLNEWAGQSGVHPLSVPCLTTHLGKKGIGLGKRARSPTAAERVAKMAKMAKEAEEISHSDFRGRASREYDERRAEGRLGTLRSASLRYPRLNPPSRSRPTYMRFFG